MLKIIYKEQIMLKKWLILAIAIIAVLILIGCNRRGAPDGEATGNIDQPAASDVFSTGENIFVEPSYPEYWTMTNLILRREPNTNAAALETMPQGTKVLKMDTGAEMTINQITANWAFVRTPDGKEGWCFGGYLADSREKAILPGIWGVRSGDYHGLFIYFSPSGRYYNGIFETGAAANGSWSVTMNKLHLDGSMIVTGDGIPLREFPLTIQNNNNIRIGEDVFERLDASVLQNNFGLTINRLEEMSRW